MGNVTNNICVMGSVEFSEHIEKKLSDNQIPYEIASGKIHFISEEEYIDVRARDYSKHYSKFCMQLSDSADGKIGMGEGSLSKETIDVIGSVFSQDSNFMIDMTLSDSYGSEEKSIFFVEDEINGGFKLETSLEDFESFFDEDEDDED